MKEILIIAIFLPTALIANGLDLIAVIAPPSYTHPAGSGEIKVYKPGSKEQIELFELAAAELSLPKSWARSKALQNILQREGYAVGQPNYTYDSGSLARQLGVKRLSSPRNAKLWPKVWESLVNGEVKANSTACGLGQLLNYNVDAFLNEYHKLGLRTFTTEKLSSYRRKYYWPPIDGGLWNVVVHQGTVRHTSKRLATI